MIVHIYTGEDGQSHFEDMPLPSALDERGRARLPLQSATSIEFIQFPGDFFSDWHPASCRMYAIILSGKVECKIGDGTVRRFGPGDVMFEEDVTGQGHSNRALDGQPVLVAFVRT
jgi:hypothetical protein